MEGLEENITSPPNGEGFFQGLPLPRITNHPILQKGANRKKIGIRKLRATLLTNGPLKGWPQRKE